MDTQYTILPSTGSMIIEMTIVIFLVFTYILYISYLSAYGTGFKPNFVLFFDMMLDRNNDQRFQTYIKNVLGDKKKEKEKAKEKTNVETFEIEKKPFLFEKIQLVFLQCLSYFYITGNKIYISKKDVSI